MSEYFKGGGGYQKCPKNFQHLLWTIPEVFAFVPRLESGASLQILLGTNDPKSSLGTKSIFYMIENSNSSPKKTSATLCIHSADTKFGEV